MENQQMLLIIAIVVFGLMIIGLALTIWEYRHHINPPQTSKQKKNNNE
jgi:hypothetical protein